MGFVSDLVGGVLGGGKSGGSNFKAQSADLLQPTNLNQIGGAYNQALSGIDQQQAFLNALSAQNGLANQSNVFNQQQALANQFQGVAGGTGPNPALQQFQNATGQNVANQAALMAGQRGSGANAGLLARQAAMQGAGIQQQAVGQGAALQAQQQLAAMQALQQQQNMMGNLANQQVGQQAAGLQNLNQFGQSEQNQLLGALGNFNNANVSNIGSQNSANAQIAGQNAKTQGGLLGGLLGAAGTAVAGPLGGIAGSMLGGAIQNSGSPSGGEFNSSKSGYTPNISFAEGGEVPGPSSFVGRFFKGDKKEEPPAETPSQQAGSALQTGYQAIKKTKERDQSILDATNPMNFQASGGKIEGHVPGKAAVKGDSLKNDTVPAMLSPGEVVIPRHVMQSADPAGNAAKFVQAVMAKKGKKG